MISHRMWTLPKRVGIKCRDVSHMPFGSRKSHYPSTVRLGRWSRAESLHSIVNETSGMRA